MSPVAPYRVLEDVFAARRRWYLFGGDWRDLVPSVTAGSVDHVITDPPYERESHSRHRRVRRKGVVVPHPLPFPPIDRASRRAIIAETPRVARRWALVFSQVEAVHPWVLAGRAAGLPYRRTCAWVKPDSAPQFSGDRPAAGYECIVCFHAPGRSRWNGGGRRGVFVYPTTDMGRVPHYHPTQKPLPLMLELIGLFTDPGDLVFDPFAGSGTTGVACLRLGRRFLGCEIDPGFAALARERLEAEERGLSLASARAGQASIFDLLEGHHDFEYERS